MASSALFLGSALVVHNVLGCAWRPSWLAGVTVSTTSVAVVYPVMLEVSFNQTKYGKAILAARFINDLGTVLALGLIFSPFTKKTLLLPAISLVSLLIFAFSGRPGSSNVTRRASELEAKYLLFRLVGPGSIAVWSGNEAVLPAYIVGMACRLRRQDHFLIRRLDSLPPELCRGQSRRLVFGCS